MERRIPCGQQNSILRGFKPTTPEASRLAGREFFRTGMCRIGYVHRLILVEALSTIITAGGMTYPEAQSAALGRCKADERSRGHCQSPFAACADGR